MVANRASEASLHQDNLPGSQVTQDSLPQVDTVHQKAQDSVANLADQVVQVSGEPLLVLVALIADSAQADLLSEALQADLVSVAHQEDLVSEVHQEDLVSEDRQGDLKLLKVKHRLSISQEARQVATLSTRM